MEGEGMMMIREGRSLKETPTWSVASVTTVMVFLCLFVERSIYRFGKWLKKTRRKALYASLEKIKEELMLLGLISLLLGQWASWISRICVNSSLFNSKFFLCSEEDYADSKRVLLSDSSYPNETEIPKGILSQSMAHQCGEGREPFVSYEDLEQLHRFLFVLGITHVVYSCITVGLSMIKIYSWRKWENQTIAEVNFLAKKNKVMRRQTTFALHHASHPWSRSRVLIWMLCFLRQFRSSIQKSDYLALRLGFITNHNLPISYNFHKYMVRSMEDEFYGIVGIGWPLWGYAIICIFINIHGLNIYFWLSFIPAIVSFPPTFLVFWMKKQFELLVIRTLEIAEPKGPSNGNQVKPRDELFWFGKPEILLRLIQFISFQNAFEMATFVWSLWGFNKRSCFMKNHLLISIRLIFGVVVQFWCSYSTVPLNVIITQMGSRHKKALIAESVRESLHSWCKRVKERSKLSVTTRSTCSLDERDEITVGSGTSSPRSSTGSLHELDNNGEPPAEAVLPDQPEHEHKHELELSSHVPDNLSHPITSDIDREYEDDDDIEKCKNTCHDIEECRSNADENIEEIQPETLLDLFQKT